MFQGTKCLLWPVASRICVLSVYILKHINMLKFRQINHSLSICFPHREVQVSLDNGLTSGEHSVCQSDCLILKRSPYSTVHYYSIVNVSPRPWAPSLLYWDNTVSWLGLSKRLRGFLHNVRMRIKLLLPLTALSTDIVRIQVKTGFFISLIQWSVLILIKASICHFAIYFPLP